MFTILTVSNAGTHRQTAATKNEALKLIPWTKIKGGSIQRLSTPGMKGWLIRISQ